MKKLVLSVLCGLMLVVVGRAGEPVGTGTVIAASMCLLPARGLSGTNASWTSISGKVVNAGQIVENAGIVYYAMNSSGIAATNTPTHTSNVGAVGAEDGIIWQVYGGSPHSKRTGLSVTKLTVNGGTTYVSIGYPARTGQGIALVTNGSTLLIPSGAPQGAVFVKPGATSDAIAAQDW